MPNLVIKKVTKSAKKKLHKFSRENGYGNTSNFVRRVVEAESEINISKEYED